MSIQQLEVEWYRKNGKYPERMRRTGDKSRELYVIGDDGWNTQHPDKKEFIERLMHCDIELEQGDTK